MDIFSRLVSRFFPRKSDQKFLMVGLDAGGKTTILYKMSSNESGTTVDTTIPTIGFNVEELKYSKAGSILAWDVGGCDKIRPLWRHYYRNMNGIVFVVDSGDRERIEQAEEELVNILKEEELRHIPFLVFCNKQDLPTAMSTNEVADKMHLRTHLGNRMWCIQSSIGPTGVGVKEGFHWLEQAARHIDSTSSAAQTVPSKHQSVIKTETPILTTPPPEVLRQVKIENSVKLAEHTAKRNALVLETEWLVRTTTTDVDFFAFLSLVEGHVLPQWDHYNHIRLAWGLMVTHGIHKGFVEIDRIVDDFIKNSSRTNGKSFNACMTRFWAYIIAYQMEVQRSRVTSVENLLAASCDVSGRAFESFLRSLWLPESVALHDGRLFAEYFDRSLIFSAKAKREMQSPDIKSLPNILSKMRKRQSRQMKLLHYIVSDREGPCLHCTPATGTISSAPASAPTPPSQSRSTDVLPVSSASVISSFEIDSLEAGYVVVDIASGEKTMPTFSSEELPVATAAAPQRSQPALQAKTLSIYSPWSSFDHSPRSANSYSTVSNYAMAEMDESVYDERGIDDDMVTPGEHSGSICAMAEGNFDVKNRLVELITQTRRDIQYLTETRGLYMMPGAGVYPLSDKTATTVEPINKSHTSPPPASVSPLAV